MSSTDKVLSGSLVALNAAALGLQLLGQAKAADAVRLVASALQSGVAIDAHMAEVAEKLNAGPLSDGDWDDLMLRIRSASDALQAAKPAG
jgi:hypothetical protein